MTALVSTDGYRRNGQPAPGSARSLTAYAEACRNAKKQRKRKKKNGHWKVSSGTSETPVVKLG